MARNVRFSFLRGGGSSLEVLYGKVSLTPTNLHTLDTTAVLPAPTTFDLINGTALATNVAPTPAPVDGTIAWAYKVKITDNFGKSWEYLVGVPDGTTEINFNVLPRYSETRPPAFGVGPAGPAGQSASIAIGTVGSGPTPAVTNTGTSTDAVLNFTLAKGDKGDKGDGVAFETKLFSDSPATYANGTTYVNGSIAAGWPVDFLTVTTNKQSWGRTVQWLVNVTKSYVAFRTDQSGSWTSLQQMPSNSLASPLLNGLMPALDKAKLDGMTPAANSKTFAAAASTYQGGFSVLQVRASDGWPIASTGTVATQKAATGSGGVGQWLYPVEGGTPQYRVSDAAGNWIPFQQVATESSVALSRNYAAPEAYGAVGDGVVDDSSSIELAINDNLTNGKAVLFDSSKTYRITRPIISQKPLRGEFFRIEIGSTGDLPATIRMDNDGHRHFEFSGEAYGETLLTARTSIQRRAWQVVDASLFSPGMLMGAISSTSWTYDPRPTSTDGRHSEIHYVASVSGNTIYSDAPAVDGYTATGGVTTTVRAIQPVQVIARNLRLVRPKPNFVGPVEDLSYVGIRLNYTVDSVVENLQIINAVSSAVQIRLSYKARAVNNNVDGTNSYGEGYAFVVAGCNFTRISGNYIANTRRASDATGWLKFISRNTVVEGNTYVGGGQNIRGDWFGWDPVTGERAARNGGFGSHGVSDLTTVRDNVTMNCWEPYVIRGSNNIFSNNTHIGQTSNTAFGLDSGGGVAVIEGNKVLSGWLGGQKSTPSANFGRAASFVRILPGFDYNGRVTIKNNYAEVGRRFILLGNDLTSETALVRHLVVTDNRIGLADGTTGGGFVLENPGPLVALSSAYWFIGPNVVVDDALASSVSLTRNINIAGAKVLEYATSGTTT